MAVAIGLAMFFVVTEARAWDGERKGFIFGGGLGLGATGIIESYRNEAESLAAAPAIQFAFSPDIRIGYAPTNKLMLYAFGVDSWFNYTQQMLSAYGGQELYGEESWTINSSLSGVGASYYLKPEAPAWIFSGGLGIAQLKAYGNNAPTATFSGFGFMLGAGYEFRKHWSAEFNFVYENPKHSVSSSVAESEYGIPGTQSFKDFSFILLVNLMGY